MILKKDRRSEAGFTLVEVLIALALMALMAALLAGALGGLRQTQRSHDQRTFAASVEPVEAYLRRVLADMRPVRLSNVTSAPMIDAHANRITFVSGYGPPGGFAGLHRITLQVIETAQAGVFDLEEVRRLYRVPLEGDGDIRTRLLTGITGLKLSYLGVPQASTERLWGDTWASSVQLPQLVALNISFATGDPRRWAPVLVAIPSGR